jgi:ketosteroid isomerase-like protein
MKALQKSLMLVAVCAVCYAAQDASEEIRAADKNWEQVFAAKNLEASVDVCAPDGAVMPPNAPIAAGREQIRKLFQGFFAIPALQLSWHPTKTGASGDLGYSTGVYQMHFNDPSGKPASDTGKYVTVWQRGGNGKWQVVRDIFNSDLPAAH